MGTTGNRTLTIKGRVRSESTAVQGPGKLSLIVVCALTLASFAVLAGEVACVIDPPGRTIDLFIPVAMTDAGNLACVDAESRSPTSWTSVAAMP